MGRHLYIDKLDNYFWWEGTYISVDRRGWRRRGGEEGEIWGDQPSLGEKPDPGSTWDKEKWKLGRKVKVRTKKWNGWRKKDRCLNSLLRDICHSYLLLTVWMCVNHCQEKWVWSVPANCKGNLTTRPSAKELCQVEEHQFVFETSVVEEIFDSQFWIIIHDWCTGLPI